MNTDKFSEIKKNVGKFVMPRYSEIPNVGLYLEQVSKYITECFSPLSDSGLTGSMISNYVKKKLVTNPVKKQYNREQIAYLIFIAVAKISLSMDEIKKMIDIQKEWCDIEKAYDFFCDELEKTLLEVFGIKEYKSDENKGVTDAEHMRKKMLASMLLIYSHKVYLDKCFTAFSEDFN